MKTKEGLISLAIILIFTTFSLCIFPGYKVFFSDQNVYLPGIYHQLNPKLFTNDILTLFNFIHYSFFGKLLIFTLKTFKMNIFYSLFALSFLSRFIYFYSIYKISEYFTNNRIFSILSLFLVLKGFSIYGTVSYALDLNLVPRVTGISFGFLFMCLFFEEKYLLSALSLSISLLLHPISAVVFIMFFYVNLFIFYRRKTSSPSLILAGLIPIISLLFLLPSIHTHIGNFSSIDPIWEKIIRKKDAFVFVTEWRENDFIQFIKSILLFAIIRIELSEMFKDREKRQYFYSIFFIPLFLFIVSFFAVDIMKIHFILELQIARSLMLWEIYSTILFSYFAYKHIKDSPAHNFYSFTLIGITLSFICKKISPEGNFIYFFLPLFLAPWMMRIKNTIKTNINLSRKEELLINSLFVLAFLNLLFIWPFLNMLTNLFLFIGVPRIVFRFFILFTFTLIFTFSYYLRNLILFSKKGILLILIFICIATIFTPIFNPKFSIYPSYFKDKSLMNACKWIVNNTKESDVFITYPYSKRSSAIRLVCHRNIFISPKDGDQVIFKRGYAIEWQKRMNLAKKLRANKFLLSKISRKYRIDYIFSDHRLHLNYPLVFFNDRYYIYRINRVK